MEIQQVKYSDLEHSKISQDLTQPFSGNRVYRNGNLVLKEGKTINREKDWYAICAGHSFTPITYICDPDELIMQYVKSIGPVNLNEVFEVIDTYRNFPVWSESSFIEYRGRIALHLANNKIVGADKLIHLLNQIDLWPTFAHGDLSIRNIIQAATGPKLIDPLYGPDRFGSYLLDYAKLAFTLKFFNNDIEGYEKVVHHSEVQPVLIAAECVRVASYNKRFNFVAENLINEL